jgi:anthraniloyl-CoA monooxygenase
LKIVCVGGGPAGLYFSLLAKKLDPRHDVTVCERNRRDDTFGWGVVFSDETLQTLADADAESHASITRAFAYWRDIDVFVGGAHVRSTGHGFCGLSRRRLLEILHARCEALGVRLVFERELADDDALVAEADLVLCADGVGSRLRERYAAHFGPSLDWRKCKFAWLGTDLRLEAFTFIFKQNEHGLFQVHAYPFDAETSTFIVECREEVWRRAGLDQADETRTLDYLEGLFRDELRGCRLLSNRSIWRTFPTVRNRSWRHGKFALIGDAAHTAHFSIGSGTKLAMEDAIALAEALERHGDDVDALLGEYEAARRDVVARTQRAAQTSLEWFENAARHARLPPLQFTFSLLTRSKRITWDNLRRRDPELVRRVGEHFAASNPHRGAHVAPPAYAVAVAPRPGPDAPPLFQPLRLRGLTLANRIVVSPMCQYSCVDGTPHDWHLVHLGSRAIGGAGLVMTEATHVSAEGRITPGCAGMYTGAHEAAWRRVVDFVHAHSGARIGMQLAHAGRKASTDVPWRGGRPLAAHEGAWEVLGASAVPYDAGWPVPRALTRADLRRVKDEFTAAAERAARAGFDHLELHMAHGYLLASFLSPLTNRRDDEYGGALEGRLRFPLEVFDAVRAVWPAERPLAVRISATDWKDGGFDGADRVGAARAFKRHGCDLIDVSGGGTVPDQQPVYGRMYQAGFSEEIRNEAGIATMAVGNIQDADQCQTLIASGRADLCALARGHLFDPYFALHAAAAAEFDGQYWPPQYLAARPGRRKG